MPVITIIAIAAFCLGIVALFFQFIRKDSKNVFLFLFIGLAGLVLFVVSHIFTNQRALELDKKQEIAQEVSTKDSAKLEEPVGEKSPEGAGDEKVEETGGAPELAKDEPTEPGLGEEADGVVQQAEEVRAAVVEEKPALILDDPNAPKVNAGKDISEVKVKEKVSFSASATAQGGAKIGTYDWNFGDGNTAQGRKVSHSYESAGEYEAILTVTDSENRQSQAKRLVSVCRPEGKIRSASNRKIEKAEYVTSAPSAVTGQFEKTYSCSKAYVEVSSMMVSTPGCTCKLSAQLSGPNCFTTNSKQIDNGGEGKMKVRASCSGDIGQYSYTITRTMSGSDCDCSWTDTVIEDVFES